MPWRPGRCTYRRGVPTVEPVPRVIASTARTGASPRPHERDLAVDGRGGTGGRLGRSQRSSVRTIRWTVSQLRVVMPLPQDLSSQSMYPRALLGSLLSVMARTARAAVS